MSNYDNFGLNCAESLLLSSRNYKEPTEELLKVYKKYYCRYLTNTIKKYLKCPVLPDSACWWCDPHSIVLQDWQHCTDLQSQDFSLTGMQLNGFQRSMIMPLDGGHWTLDSQWSVWLNRLVVCIIYNTLMHNRH